MLRRIAPFVFIFALTTTAAQEVQAQSSSGLKARIEQELFTFGSCGEPLCLDVDPSLHGNHFKPVRPRPCRLAPLQAERPFHS